MELKTKIELPKEITDAIKEAVIQAFQEAKNDIQQDDFPLYMNKKQAAKYLGVATNTLSTWVANDEVPYKQIGGVYRFNRIELDKFMTTK